MSEKYAAEGARVALTRLTYEATLSREAQGDEYGADGVMLWPRFGARQTLSIFKKNFFGKALHISRKNLIGLLCRP